MSESNNLGDILVQMGIVTVSQLEEALRFQKEATRDDLLGEILVAGNVCSVEQIEAAIDAQRGLRSSNLSKQALAAARVAGQRKKVMRNANLDMIYQGARALKRVRGDEFTPVMGIHLPAARSKG